MREVVWWQVILVTELLLLVLLPTWSRVCTIETFSISITWPAKTFPPSLLRCGDICWLLKSIACLIMFTFVNSFFSLKYLLLLEQQTAVLVFTTESSVVFWVSRVLRDPRSAKGWLEKLFWFGLVSVFFTCKIMFLEWMKKDTRDLLGVNPKNLCLVIYQLGELKAWAHSPCKLHYSFQFLLG